MLRVLYEDNHYIAINKHAGDIVQADKTKDIPLSEIVAQYIKKKYNKPKDAFVGVVHRLDRPVSGVILFAKTSKGLTRANLLFANCKVDKKYWAIVEGEPPNSKEKIVHWLLRKSKQNKSYVYTKKVERAKEAILTYKKIKSLKNYNLLEISLETGRHHQIRAQLSFIGCCIRGDLKYGAKRSNRNTAGISLHSRSIAFIHPIKKELLIITAPLPDEPIWQACK